MMLLRLLSSAVVRRARDVSRHVRRLLNEQRDLLNPDSAQAVAQALRELELCLRSGADKAAIQTRLDQLISVAESSFLPAAHPGLRENVKEFFVAATVIMAFTTFFLQLTKIPTNSLLPTLYGITEYDLRSDPGFRIPSAPSRWWQYWFSGVSYYELIAGEAGELREVEPARLVVPFIKKQRLRVGERWYTIWFPPDELQRRAGLRYGQRFQKGEPILRVKVVSGDHLFVDRFTYNFRRPERGEIIVFKTRGIPDLGGDQLYIKRLVALPNERVRIGNDQHLRIDGVRLDATTPHFESLYTFPPVPTSHGYFGHVNQLVANRHGSGRVAPLFHDENEEYVVGPRHYLVMGDNTMNSLDSRAWGDLPRENIIGKYWFVYWPFTERFGWSVR